MMDKKKMNQEYSPVKFKDRIPGALLITREGKEEEGGIVDANRDLLNLFECESLEELKQISNDSFFGLIYPDDIGTLRWYIRIYYGEIYPADSIRQKLRIRYRIQTKNGKIIPVTESARMVEDEELGTLTYRNIERSEEGMSTAYQDDLTGLLTMSGLHDTIRTRRQRSSDFEPATYIYMNLTNFKRYNMQYGFDAGNVYLCRVSSILRNTFGSAAVVARITADQFSIYTTDPAVLSQIQRAHDEVAKIRPESTCELKAGIYEISRTMKDIPLNVVSDMAKNACDTIMDDPNRDIQVYDQRIADEIRMQTYIAANIDNAIQNHYIRVYYQPVIRGLTGALCGFEALSRWEDPTYGFLSPKDFITTLEQNRLIHKLDMYVLEEICRQIRLEMKEGRTPVPVSFNLSRVDIMMNDIFDRVEEIIDRYDIDHDMIRIEITESMIMKDPQQMRDVISKFRNAGFQVWMDDFGSGYSSLNMLKDFSFDELKLDMEFLHSATPQSREIIGSMVHMAKNIGVHTLAEGVETKEQVEFLRNIGCEKMQGYYFGKPAPYRESFHHCVEEMHMPVEAPEWNTYMDRIGRVNLQTDKALGVYHCNTARSEEGLQSCLIYANARYEKVMSGLGCPVFGYPTLPEDDSLLQRVDSFLCNTSWDQQDPDEEIVMSTTQNGHYINISFRELGHTGNIRTFAMMVNDITREERRNRPERIDATIRSLINVCQNVFVAYLDDDEIVPLYQDRYFRQLPGTEYPDIHKWVSQSVEDQVHEEDRERCLKLLDVDTVLARIAASPSRMLEDYVRIIGEDGQYHWVIVELVQEEDTTEDAVIATLKHAVYLDSHKDAAEAFLSGIAGNTK